jgi:3'-phosphoadenosine 5'-phosphosulfate sulfotransferase (PAPS reductase)/FAD synthetase
MAWLAAHSALLFPQDGGTAHRWDELIHLQAQRAYYVAEGLDGLLLGRRLADGNYCGTQGRYTTRSGLTYLSPLYDWTHEEVLTFLEMHEVELPPIYEWRHGWTCGTHPWAGRQHTGSVMNGWREVYEIDRGIVRAAAAWIASAQDFLRRLG